MKKTTKSRSKSKKLPSKNKEVGYSMGGAQCDPESSQCLAKVTFGIDNVKIHMVKCGNPPSGVWGPCNPVGLGFDVTHLTKNDNMSGRPYYEFVKVTIQGWELYKKFLETGNPGYLNEFSRYEGL